MLKIPNTLFNSFDQYFDTCGFEIKERERWWYIMFIRGLLLDADLGPEPYFRCWRISFYDHPKDWGSPIAYQSNWRGMHLLLTDPCALIFSYRDEYNV